MRKFLVIAALLVTAAPLAAAQTPDKPAQPAGDKVALAGAEQAVTERVSAYLAAMRKGDAAAIAPFFADDYAATTETGGVQTKAQRLEWAKGDAARLSTLDYQDLKVRVYGETAVVTGLAASQGEGGTKVNRRFTHVWVRQGGEWRMVAAQTTPVMAAPAAGKKP